MENGESATVCTNEVGLGDTLLFQLKARLVKGCDEICKNVSFSFPFIIYVLSNG